MAEHETRLSHDTSAPAYTRADTFQRRVNQRDMVDRLVAFGQRHADDVDGAIAPGPESLESPLMVVGLRFCAHHVDRAERAWFPLRIVTQASSECLQACAQVLVQHVRISGG